MSEVASTSKEEYITGLQIWNPQDSFNAPHNIVAYQECLTNLQLLDIQFVPGSPDLHVVARSELYQSVNEPLIQSYVDYIESRRDNFSALQEQRPIDNTDEAIREEALARALHLALGRSCLIAAGRDGDDKKFKKATQDLYTVFSAAKRRMHTVDMLYLPYGNETIMYDFARSAQDRSLFTERDAMRIVAAIDKAMLPNKKNESWYDTTGYHLQQKIVAAKTTRRKPVIPDTQERQREAHTLVRKRVPEKNAVVYTGPRARYSVFVADFSKGQTTHFAERLRWLHRKHCDRGEVWDMSSLNEKDQLRMVNYAVAGYFELRKSDSPVAQTVFRFLNDSIRNTRRERLTAVAAVLCAQYNAVQAKDQHKLPPPLPGVEYYEQTFNIARKALSALTESPETARQKRYAEVVESYLGGLAAHYSQSDK